MAELMPKFGPLGHFSEGDVDLIQNPGGPGEGLQLKPPMESTGGTITKGKTIQEQRGADS